MGYTDLLFKAATKPIAQRVAVNALAGATLGGIAGGAYSSHKGEGFGRGFAKGALVGGIVGGAFGFNEKTSLTNIAEQKATGNAVAEELTQTNPKPSSTANTWATKSEERKLAKAQKATERIKRAKEEAEIASRPPFRDKIVPLKGDAANKLAAETQQNWINTEIDRQASTRRRAAIFFKSQDKEILGSSMDREVIAGWDQSLNDFMNGRQAQMPPGAIKIYRGVYDNTENIGPLDWVTTNRKVAETYAGTGPGSRILEKVVDGSELRQLNSVHDYFTYAPEGTNWLEGATGRKLQQSRQPAFGEQYGAIHARSVETLAEQGLYGKGILDYPEIHAKYGNPVVEDIPYQTPRPWPKLSEEHINTKRMLSEQESTRYVAMDTQEWVPPTTEEAKLAKATADAESAAAIAKRDQYYKDLEDLKNTSSGVTPPASIVMDYSSESTTRSSIHNFMSQDKLYSGQYFSSDDRVKTVDEILEKVKQLQDTGKAGPIMYGSSISHKKWEAISKVYTDMTGNAVKEMPVDNRPYALINLVKVV